VLDGVEGGRSLSWGVTSSPLQGIPVLDLGILILFIYENSSNLIPPLFCATAQPQLPACEVSSDGLHIAPGAFPLLR